MRNNKKIEEEIKKENEKHKKLIEDLNKRKERTKEYEVAKKTAEEIINLISKKGVTIGTARLTIVLVEDFLEGLRIEKDS